jgi:hypothetical protein
MSTISFKTPLLEINTWNLVLLPKDESAKLSSRGMVMVEGTINEAHFQTALEPDGRGSHWLKVDKAMREAIGAKTGDTITLVFEQTNNWPEPELPVDLKAALDADAEVKELWMDITPMARWDWIRWIRATASQETRAHRIEVAFSKLKNGERRPCCFNRNMCTEAHVAKSGVLLAP